MDRQSVNYYEYFIDNEHGKKVVRSTKTSLRHYLDSDRIWRQGPKGGVRIIKENEYIYGEKYVTKNENAMKEFMWVKLQAVSNG